MVGQQEDFSKIKVESEKLLLLEDVLGWDGARSRAEAAKVKAFNSLLHFLTPPLAEDIEVIYEERRFEAFWHVVGTSSFEYKKRNKYKIPVGAEVVDLNVLGQEFVVDKDGQTFTLESLEHCRENYREEVMVDAKIDQKGNFTKYLNFNSQLISSTDSLTADGTPVVYLETRASTLVRQVLQNLVKPIKADEIMDEKITIHDLNLYFYPVYTFEFHWKLKNKKTTVAFDGVTGELNLKAAKITDTLKKNFTNDDLFEFSKEIAQNLVPGGGLAVMMGKKVFEMTRKDK